MAAEIVPPGDPRCGWCGDPEERDTSFICEDCAEKLRIESGIEIDLLFGDDPKGRTWADRRPDDPDQN